ncbi:MAG: hypothetical protein IJ932_01615 [Ruminococcus sp.]|nr:hypothetical protein [Ruminococcus sp.]
MKKILSILISIMIIISAVSVPASVNAAVKIKNKTLYMYTEGISLDGGNGNHAYKYSVKNKKYIKVDFDGGEVGGIGYQLTVSARKITGKKKPVITIYYNNSSGKKVIVKKFRFTVKPTRKFKTKKVLLYKGEKKLLPFNSYQYTKKLKYEFSNKGIVSVKDKSVRSKELYVTTWADDSDYGACAIGRKYGKTKVTVKLKGTNVTLGKFIVTVKDVKASVSKKYKTVTLRNSPYGLVAKHGMYLLTVINHRRADAKYSVEIKNKKIAESGECQYCRYGDKEPCIMQKKVGRTRVNVYEKRNGNKTKIGYFALRVVKAKMAEVMRYIRSYDDEGIELAIKEGEKINLKKRVYNHYLDMFSGIGYKKFKSSDYKMTFKSSCPDKLKVSEKGIVKCTGKFDNLQTVKCVVKFSDGSKDGCCAEFIYGDEDDWWDYFA